METLDSSSYDTDKGPHYIKFYERFFGPFRTGDTALLELGVFRGGSLLMWRDYFQTGTIVGVDLTPPEMPKLDRLHVYAGDATSSDLYARIEAETSIAAFDLIIDDASHFGDLTKAAFDLLFLQRLKSGGYYVLEDWGTAYRGGWPDGEPLRSHTVVRERRPHRARFPSHDYGMAGYLKQLIDCTAAPDVIAGGGTVEALPIESITVCHGLAFIQKA